MVYKYRTLFLAAGSCLASSLALGAPPVTSAYFTDPQTSYVQDETSQSIGQVNMITCIMSAMRPDALVNKGPYIALVDQNKCSSDQQTSTSNSGGSAAGAQAPDYMTAVVNSTRASNSDPMLVGAWISIKQGGDQPTTVFVHISATEAPSATNPYGAFRIDYCGKPDAGGTCMLNGFMQGGSGTLSYYEADSGDGSSTTALKLSSVGTTSGSGSINTQQSHNGQSSTSVFDFAYNSGLFLRNDNGGGSQCFSRDATDPATGLSVWSYGLYDSNTGAQIQRNSGFPIQYLNAGVTYQGFVGYYGLQLPTAATATLVSGSSTVQSLSNSTGGTAPVTKNYSVIIGRGNLVRYTRLAKTLQDINQIAFNVFVGDLGSSGLPDPNAQYQMHWDEPSGKFIATAEIQCSQNGCTTSNLPGPIAIDPSFWSNMGGVQGNSQSLGGNLFINLNGASSPLTSSAVAVAYYVQALVYPDDSSRPSTLYCVENCPTVASLEAYLTQGQGTVASPYVASTYNNMQPAPASALVSYTVDANAMLNDGSGAVAFSDPSAYQQFPQYQNGIMSGRLFASLSDAVCDSSVNPPQYCDWAVSSADSYYVWQTGPNNWNQFSAVKDSSGNFVHFDAPLQVNFQVPTGAAYGSYAGTSLVLQYNDFGDLWGLPGACVSSITNQAADCSDPNAMYVPSFVIPFDGSAAPQLGFVTSTANHVTTTYLVKWLQRQIRFAVKPVSDCAAGNLQTSTTQLPDASTLQDPSSSSSSVYVGSEPTVTTAPRVIQGQVQY